MTEHAVRAMGRESFEIGLDTRARRWDRCRQWSGALIRFMPAPPAYRAHPETRWQNCQAHVTALRPPFRLASSIRRRQRRYPSVARQRAARRHNGRKRASARSHYARHQRIAARYRAGALPVSDVITTSPVTTTTALVWRASACAAGTALAAVIGCINAAPARAHSGKGKNFGGIAANGSRFLGKDLMAKRVRNVRAPAANRGPASRACLQPPRFLLPTHRLGTRRGQPTNVNQQRIGDAGKLFSLFGLNHHRG